MDYFSAKISNQINSTNHIDMNFEKNKHDLYDPSALSAVSRGH